MAQRGRNRPTEDDRNAWWGPEADNFPTARSMRRARGSSSLAISGDRTPSMMIGTAVNSRS